MNQLVEKVLSHGGVEVPASDKVDYMAILESWIGLPNTKEWETEMMEDSAPFEVELYESLTALLSAVWKPDEEMSMLHSNVLLEMDCPPKEMSLYKAMDSVRVTRMLRYWMDLNVQGGRTMVDEADKTLSHYLLEHPMTKESSSTDTKQNNPLIQALYYHIRQLPQLQAQIHFYSQSLMRSDRQTQSGQPLANAQSRLAHYQETQQVSTRLNQEWDDHLEALEYLVGDLYTLGNTEIRRECRSLFGSVWSQFVSRAGGGGGVKMENTSSSGIRMTLRVLHRILLGTSGSLQKSHEHLLTYHLIPLHRPNSMVLWRDQTSLLELYHEPLVQCIAILLQKKPELIPKVIAALLEPEIWTKAGNTPKLVLLLHEIDTYIGILPDPSKHAVPMGSVFSSLLRTLGVCMASDHSRLAERALSFMKNSRFQSLVESSFEQAVTILMPFLVRTEPAWNPTVRKMTWTVLKKFQDFDEETFLRVNNRCFPDSSSTRNIIPVPLQEGSAQKESKQTHAAPPKDFTLKSAMGGWKPPGTSASLPHTGMPPPPGRAGRQRGAPPLAVTGVAPWAMQRPQKPLPSAKKNPPLGVTGVAPWAMKDAPPVHTKRRAAEALSGGADGTSIEEQPQPVDGKDQLPRVLAYMNEIKPPEQEEGGSAWSKAQMAETPTLLPNLKFHDLVFGHDLGEGAFGSVRYARLIDRSRTRSQWPEYAVKIISTEKIKEMGYEASVQRELAVLHGLSHPGITRLVSSFRFREGVYFVLEYASGGDLHSLLRKNGSIDHESTRFVIGEIVAGLASIHELGLVYADLKPENVVITESGHLKITDFGGSRPVTPAAKNLIESRAKNIFKELRDGDWKPQSKQNDGFSIMEEDEEESGDGKENADAMDGENDDIRIEGTTAYLPPEVVMGGFPTLAADSWALGCVLYQCLTGRPPILEADEAQTKSRIVSFNATGAAQNDEEQLFSDSHATHITQEARGLIVQLLNRHPIERPSMTQTSQHDFFKQVGMDVFSLHRKPAHPLDVGDVSPVADAQWSRRQFSSIWAPQPQAYDVSLEADDNKQRRGDAPSGPIVEGEEATSFFSKIGSLSSSVGAGVSKIPLPTAPRTIEEN